METVAVIFGGRSAEHDVSIVTALASVIRPLELSQRYNVEAIYIAKDGSWYWDEKLKDITLFTSGKIDEFLQKTQPVSVQLDGGMKLIKTSGLAARKQTQKVDIVFPAMHGTYGEDGALMGLLDMAGIPYVGCGVSAAAIAMDKVLTKQIARVNDIATSNFLAFLKEDIASTLEGTAKDIEKQLTYPLFVKPAHLGSSIGISRVTNKDELVNALELAIYYDDKLIVEEAVANLIEVTLPIIGNDQPKPALLERPMTKAEDFFDFDTKYMQGGKKGKASKGAQGYSQLPAELPKPLYAQAEALALRVYKAVGCTGTARVDMLIDEKEKTVYLNEINPLPGDLYAHNWNRAGVSNLDLVLGLIGLAKERYATRESLATTFETNYLQQF